MIQSFNLKKRKEQQLDSNFTEQTFKSISKNSLQKFKDETKEDSKLDQNLSLHSLQRHLSLIKLEEYLIIITFIAAGIVGRILLQGFPSVEPITFFAILAGSLFGWRKGAITGASSWYLSNFFMFGGQGPWTIVHIAMGALAGFLGGVMLKKPNYTKAIIVMLIATLAFEISINLMSGLLFFGILVSFLTAIPFTITHIISNIGFSLLIPKTRKTILEKGKLNEKELCDNLIRKIKSKSIKSKND